MYDLPKIHKDGAPLRPIISTIGSPSYKPAKELAQILTPLTGNPTQAVKNSADRIHKMQEHPEDQLISLDVSNLFTQVLVDEALRMVEKKLSVDGLLKDRTSIPTAHMVELTELCLLTYLKFYEQSEGAAMGSLPLSGDCQSGSPTPPLSLALMCG